MKAGYIPKYKPFQVIWVILSLFVLRCLDFTEGGYGPVAVDNRDRAVVEEILNLNDIPGKTFWKMIGVKKGRVASLNFYGENIDTLPPSIGRLTELELFVLVDSDLRSIPTGLKNATELRMINLSGNQLTKFPKFLLELTKLTELDIRGNKLYREDMERFKADILKNNPGLRREGGKYYDDQSRGMRFQDDSLLIEHIVKKYSNSHEPFSTFARDYKENKTRIQKLDLIQMDLSEIPREIFSLRGLVELKLNQNNISTIPSAISKLIKLRVLNLNDNALETLGELPKHLPKLTQLFARDNKLKALPSDLSNWKTLEEFNFEYNEIAELPKSISALSLLEVLHADNNQLTSIPSSILEMSKLRTIHIRHNKLKLLPETIGWLPSFSTIIYADSNQLKSLPSSVTGPHSHIERISLSGNKICDLDSVAQAGLTASTYMINRNWAFYQSCPDTTPLHADTMIVRAWFDSSGLDTLSVRNYVSLVGYRIRSLNFDSIGLKAMLNSISGLSDLRQIFARRLPITSLPASIGQLPRLFNLEVENCELQSLPAELCQLKTLQSLKLSHNKLTELPKDIGRLTGLFGLRVDNNNLRTLPESILSFKKPRSFRLDNNNLCALPDKQKLWADQIDPNWGESQICE